MLLRGKCLRPQAVSRGAINTALGTASEAATATAITMEAAADTTTTAVATGVVDRSVGKMAVPAAARKMVCVLAVENQAISSASVAICIVNFTTQKRTTLLIAA